MENFTLSTEKIGVLAHLSSRRHVIFAYFYYGFLGAALLSVLIWH
jgi:hypothetical protein